MEHLCALESRLHTKMACDRGVVLCKVILSNNCTKLLQKGSHYPFKARPQKEPFLTPLSREKVVQNGLTKLLTKFQSILKNDQTDHPTDQSFCTNIL
jgi:hypothetical protein